MYPFVHCVRKLRIVYMYGNKFENTKMHLKSQREYAIIDTRETKARRLTLFWRGNPPHERKEGDADVCYIY